MPVTVAPGRDLEAGVLNLTGAIDVEVLRAARESFLSEMLAMLAAAESGRGRYVRVADRAARLYAPVVHLLAAATFLAWLSGTGEWHTAPFVAISVLIITCPCALGLAVPVVHIVAAGRLFGEGILMKDGSALVRLAGIDVAAFDKTGTLTTGTPTVTDSTIRDAETAVAKALALHSTHPAPKALAAYLEERPALLEEVREVPGRGIEGSAGGRRARLGQRAWVVEIAGGDGNATQGPAFAMEDGEVCGFTLSETLRPGGRAAVASMQAAGVEVQILSGDAPQPVAQVAQALGVAKVRDGAHPAEKIQHL